VAGENLLAGVTDLRPIGLETAEDTQRVIGIDLQLGLAKPGDVGMAGGALAVVALVWGGRRLRRELLGGCGCYGEDESDRQHRYPDHGPPICGHPARRHFLNLISYFARTVARPGRFYRVVRKRLPRCVIGPQQQCGDALAPRRDAGIHLAVKGG